MESGGVLALMGSPEGLITSWNGHSFEEPGTLSMGARHHRVLMLGIVKKGPMG